MKRSNWIAILIFLVFLFMGGLWLVDMGVNGMLLGSDLNGLGWCRDPVTSYHLGLLISTASGVAAFLIAVHHILKGM